MGVCVCVCVCVCACVDPPLMRVRGGWEGWEPQKLVKPSEEREREREEREINFQMKTSGRFSFVGVVILPLLRPLPLAPPLKISIISVLSFLFSPWPLGAVSAAVVVAGFNSILFLRVA